MRKATFLAALSLSSAAYAQSLTEHSTPSVLPSPGTHYATGAGAPSVVWDPANGQFVMFFESRFGDWGDTPGCAKAGDVLWGVSRATSPDGLTWSVDAAPVLEPLPGSYYGCVVAHPDVLFDGNTWHMYFKAYQEDTACDVSMPAWGCYEVVGVGYASSVDGINWNVEPEPAIVVNDDFGFPTVAQLDTEWTLLLSNTRALSRATAAAPSGPWNWDSTAVLSPDPAFTAMEDEVFEPNMICEDYQPIELYFGGYNRNDSDPWNGPIEETALLWGTSADSGTSWDIDFDPGVNPVRLWDNLAGDTAWRHWDVIRVGGQTLVYYAVNNGTGNEIHLAYSGADTNFDTTTYTDNVCWTSDEAPRANDDEYAVVEDGILHIPPDGLLTNDSDREGATLTAILATDVSDGTLTLYADGSFDYEPDANFSGFDGFAYVANDGTSNSATAVVTIGVTPTNDAPFGQDHQYDATEGVTRYVDAVDGLLVGAGDPDGDSVTAETGAPVTFGVLNMSIDGSFDYLASGQDCGQATFEYYVDDGITQSIPYTVTIDVACVNDAPIGVDDGLYVTPEGTQLVVPAAGVLSNDTDPEGDPLSAILVSTTLYGTLVLAPDGGFTYDPDPLYNGPDSFTYTANDGTLDSASVTVDIDVTAVPNPPSGMGENYEIDEDTTLVVADADGVLLNDTDPDGDALTATIVDLPAYGLLAFDSINALGGFEYTPNADYSGPDSFTYEISDPSGLVAGPYTATLNVLPVNDAPVGVDDQYAVDFNTILIADVGVGVLANDTDVDSDTLVVAVTNQPTGGTLDLEPTDGSFVYTPGSEFSGVDTFTYEIFDGIDTSAEVSVQIDVAEDHPTGTGTGTGSTTGTGTGTTTTGTTDTGEDPDAKGCGCATSPGAGPSGALGALFLGLLAFRRRE